MIFLEESLRVLYLLSKIPIVIELYFQIMWICLGTLYFILIAQKAENFDLNLYRVANFINYKRLRKEKREENK